MVSKEDVLLFVPVIILFIIIILGVSGILTAPLPGAGTECNLGLVCPIGAALGFPQEWLNTKTFLWYSFIPIMGIWFIIFGFLDRIHIFRRASINGILSFLIAFSMIPLGLFVIIVSILFSIMGIYSVILFVGLFFIGTYLYARGLVGAWKGVYGGYQKAISAQDSIIAKAQGDVAKLQNEMEMAQKGTGKYHGVGAADIQQLLQNTIGPRLLDAQKKLAQAQAQKKFLQDQEKSVKKTFQLQEKA